MSLPEVFVVSSVRTAIGTFGGTLKDVPLPELATTAVKAALERSGAPLDAVGHLAMGNVIPTEPRDAYLSRVAAMQAGLPQEEIGRRVGVNNRYALEKALRQASRFSPQYLALVHRRLMEADMAVKTGELDERLALEILVGRLSAA